jgi:soluble lytic murein transglycosylase-like protein
VREHPRTVPVSEKNPEGKTIVDGHCRSNPSHHEIFVADEISRIAIEHFKDIKNRPTPDDLGFLKGNAFDEFIAGWTQFWNEIFMPKDPLDPDLVKALIANESSFRTQVDTKSKDGTARGLIQITEGSRKILADQKGELKDFLITVSKDEIKDPNVNIFAGIRWLFHKKNLATHHLKREATWMEAISEYKGIRTQLGRVEKADRIMRDIAEKHTRLKAKKELIKQ